MLTSNNGNGAGGQYNRRYVRIILDVKVSNGIKIVIGGGEVGEEGRGGLSARHLSKTASGL